ncbi:MAG: hypothetical protein ACRC62_18150 [Microcoleus sp.]
MTIASKKWRLQPVVEIVILRQTIQPGDTFGRLTVKQIAPKRNQKGATYWACSCLCGGEKFATSGDLRRGFVKSCGCLHHEAVVANGKANLQDLTGERFGQLVVVRQVDSPNKAALMYECKCDCGNTKNCYASNLRRGGNKSCGCLKAAHKNLSNTSSAIVNSAVNIPNLEQVASLRNACVLGQEFREARSNASIFTLKEARRGMKGKTRIAWTEQRIRMLENYILDPKTAYSNRTKNRSCGASSLFLPDSPSIFTEKRYKIF